MDTSQPEEKPDIKREEATVAEVFHPLSYMTVGIKPPTKVNLSGTFEVRHYRALEVYQIITASNHVLGFVSACNQFNE